jgi:hypothetical protein
MSESNYNTILKRCEQIHNKQNVIKPLYFHRINAGMSIIKTHTQIKYNG